MEKVMIAQAQHLNRVYARLFAARPQSMAVIGDWQVGKSSFMAQIPDPEVYKDYLPEGTQPLFFSYDIAAGLEWEPLLIRMGEELAQAAKTQIPEGSPPHSFQALVRALNDKYCIYVLFDNFELLTQNPDVPLEFYSFLRSLANSYRIAYVTCSRASLQTLCVRQDICESPFFNIFTNLELRGFSPADTAQLIKLSGSGRDPNRCFELCAGHPGLTVRYLESRLSDEDFITGCADYASQWFAQFDADSREVLKAVAASTPIAQALRYLEETLKRKGHLDAQGQVASLVFRQWLSAQTPTQPEKTGLFKRLFKK